MGGLAPNDAMGSNVGLWSKFLLAASYHIYLYLNLYLNITYIRSLFNSLSCVLLYIRILVALVIQLLCLDIHLLKTILHEPNLPNLRIPPQATVFPRCNAAILS